METLLCAVLVVTSDPFLVKIALGQMAYGTKVQIQMVCSNSIYPGLDLQFCIESVLLENVESACIFLGLAHSNRKKEKKMLAMLLVIEMQASRLEIQAADKKGSHEDF
jgi:hypothetical protein